MGSTRVELKECVTIRDKRANTKSIFVHRKDCP